MSPLDMVDTVEKLNELPRGAVVLLASSQQDPTEFTVAHRELVSLPSRDELRWFVGELSNGQGDGHESVAIWHLYADTVRPRLLYVHDGSALVDTRRA